MKPIKLYWCDRLVAGRQNFGDWLSPALVGRLSGREVEYARPQRADLVAVGSILHRVPAHFWNRRVHVWGTGFVAPPAQQDKPRHHYHAVRGRRTAELLSPAKVTTFGDPGLLVDLLLPEHADTPKRWSIGVVPHHVDQNHPSVKTFLERWPEARLIDILGGTKEFLTGLAACRFVLSSSLHGLIAADAFGIPNAWVEISQGVRGGGFKFHDYYSAFGLGPATPLTLEQADAALVEKISAAHQRPGLAEIKAALHASFPFPR